MPTQPAQMIQIGICPYCGDPIYADPTSVSIEGAPVDGDIAGCSNCANVAVFRGDIGAFGVISAAEVSELQSELEQWQANLASSLPRPLAWSVARWRKPKTQ